MNNLINFIIINPSNIDDIYCKYFGNYQNWNIICGDLENLIHYDCLVTPGNSYGDMTGGFDLSVIELLGPQFQSKLTKLISSLYPNPHQYDPNSWDSGFQPLGTSLIIPTENDRFTYLCHTPTMECAKSIKSTPNVYMAMNSILYELYKHNINKNCKSKIKTVVLPCLGTGFGQLSYDESFKQMCIAYAYFRQSYPNMF